MDNKIIKIRELEKKLTKFQEIPRGNEIGRAHV